MRDPLLDPTRQNRRAYLRAQAWRWGLPTGLTLGVLEFWQVGVERGAWIAAIGGAVIAVIFGVFLGGPLFGYGMWLVDRWMQGRDD
jgi:hypothetical protein